MDDSFDPGAGSANSIFCVAVGPGGKVVIANGSGLGKDTARRRVMMRLNSDGSIDNTFNSLTGIDYWVRCIQSQPDGKIVIGGQFGAVNDTSRNRIARLNADGTLDNSFDPGAGANNAVLCLASLPEGKALIGGSFQTINNTNRNGIARLDADGSLDTSFDPGTGANGEVDSLVLQSDGKVLVGGQFSTINGTNRNRIARLNADGSLDSGFNPGTGASHSISCVAVQSDGKVLIGGGFSSVNGISRNRIARLNTDGSVDAGFDPGTGANGWVYSIAVISPDKVLVGGQFNAFNGSSRCGLARLNADGSLDTNFNSGLGTNDLVLSMAVRGDGKVIIGGSFQMIANTSRNCVARLNADGSLDTVFDPGVGANDTVDGLAVQQDGRVLLAGGFTAVNGVARHFVARLLSNEADQPLLMIEPIGQRVAIFFGSQLGVTYTLEFKSQWANPDWTMLAPSVMGTGGTLILQDTNAVSGSRFYRVRCAGTGLERRGSK